MTEDSAVIAGLRQRLRDMRRRGLHTCNSAWQRLARGRSPLLRRDSSGLGVNTKSLDQATGRRERRTPRRERAALSRANSKPPTTIARIQPNRFFRRDRKHTRESRRRSRAHQHPLPRRRRIAGPTGRIRTVARAAAAAARTNSRGGDFEDLDQLQASRLAAYRRPLAGIQSNVQLSSSRAARRPLLSGIFRPGRAGRRARPRSWPVRWSGSLRRRFARWPARCLKSPVGSAFRNRSPAASKDSKSSTHSAGRSSPSASARTTDWQPFRMIRGTRETTEMTVYIRAGRSSARRESTA